MADATEIRSFPSWRAWAGHSFPGFSEEAAEARNSPVPARPPRSAPAVLRERGVPACLRQGLVHVGDHPEHQPDDRQERRINHGDANQFHGLHVVGSGAGSRGLFPLVGYISEQRTGPCPLPAGARDDRGDDV